MTENITPITTALRHEENASAEDLAFVDAFLGADTDSVVAEANMVMEAIAVDLNDEYVIIDSDTDEVELLSAEAYQQRNEQLKAAEKLAADNPSPDGKDKVHISFTGNNTKLGPLDKLLIAGLEVTYPYLSDYVVDFNNNRAVITILFPHVNMVTSKGLKHEIFDGYLRIVINMSSARKSGTGYSSLSFARGKLSVVEMIAGYSHSHAHGFSNTASVINFVGMCTGTTELVTIAGELNSMTSDTFNATTWELFLFLLTNYMAYENTDNPYMYINSLGSQTKRVALQPITLAQISSVIRDFFAQLQGNDIPGSNFIQLGDLWLIGIDSTNDDFKDMLENCPTCTKVLFDPKENKYYSFGADSTNHSTRIRQQTAAFRKNPILVFRGNPIMFELMRGTVEEEDFITEIHPDLVKECASKISSYLNALIRNDSRIKTVPLMNVTPEWKSKIEREYGRPSVISGITSILTPSPVNHRTRTIDDYVTEAHSISSTQGLGNEWRAVLNTPDTASASTGITPPTAQW